MAWAGSTATLKPGDIQNDMFLNNLVQPNNVIMVFCSRLLHTVIAPGCGFLHSQTYVILVNGARGWVNDLFAPPLTVINFGLNIPGYAPGPMFNVIPSVLLLPTFQGLPGDPPMSLAVGFDVDWSHTLQATSTQAVPSIYNYKSKRVGRYMRLKAGAGAAPMGPYAQIDWSSQMQNHRRFR